MESCCIMHARHISESHLCVFILSRSWIISAHFEAFCSTRIWRRVSHHLHVLNCNANPEAVTAVMLLALMIQCYKLHLRHCYLYWFTSIALIIRLLISQSDWFSDNRNNANSPLINEWISRSINHECDPAPPQWNLSGCHQLMTHLSFEIGRMTMAEVQCW